jgi:hypothetical protein
MENYSHIFISENIVTDRYISPRAGGKKHNIPQRNRLSHAAALSQKFDAIWHERKQLNQQREAAHIPTRDGTYLSFRSQANHDLITKSLENISGKNDSKWIRLLNIQSKTDEAENKVTIATVYIPKGEEGYFVKKIKDYRDKNFGNSDKPRNADLVNSIEDVSLSLLESLWTDKIELMPAKTAKWCEVWLNVNTREQKEQKQISLFKQTLLGIGIECKDNSSIIFPERAVLLINANKNQLVELMQQSDFLAEFRAEQEPAGFWINESAYEQQNWVDDLLRRINVVESNVKICILDTGVNNGHQLLQPLIDDTNTLTVNPAWGTNDHAPGRGGHGTLMAGIAGYGEMERTLETNNAVILSHKLCSVKILPREDETGKELWGDITCQGIARAEISNPHMKLIYCMAITSADDTNRGHPSSWSGAIDNLTYGDGEDTKLMIISAGNIRDESHWRNYPNSNYTASVENPAQSWNALTVGAYTKKIQVNDSKKYSGYTPLAQKGDLSPYSTTSRTWEKKWAIKPDVVFEGGNLLKAPDNSIIRHEDLELLSTSKSFNIKSFETINATSAATAQASWFAAKIAYEYPNARPETIRGLIVHSADWDNAMLKAGRNNKIDYNELLKTFGYGIPNLDRALYSHESALTYIAEETIQPFELSGSTRKTKDCHVFNLPWPRELLSSMGAINVKLRITLSYFIQPGAGEIGWKDKYRYHSHVLQFDINSSTEDLDAFKQRINKAKRDNDYEHSRSSGSTRWKIGANIRNNGSIHSDIVEGTAADLATCNHIAVFPATGWWRERNKLGKTENKVHYSLIISLETPIQDVPLYTTVKNIIKIPVEIPVK